MGMCGIHENAKVGQDRKKLAKAVTRKSSQAASYSETDSESEDKTPPPKKKAAPKTPAIADSDSDGEAEATPKKSSSKKKDDKPVCGSWLKDGSPCTHAAQPNGYCGKHHTCRAKACTHEAMPHGTGFCEDHTEDSIERQFAARMKVRST